MRSGLRSLENDTRCSNWCEAMHGTFPNEGPGHRSSTDFGSLWTGLAFAALPLLLAVAVAMFRFGGNMTLDNILEILRDASLATPM